MSADAEVVIPTWNGRDRLRRALESLRAQTVAPGICVVDNGSTDGTAEMLDREFPEVRVVSLSSNHGFGRAVNRGAATSNARLLVLLNDDAVADRSLVAELVAVQHETGAEMVAASLLDADRTIESAGVAIDRSLVAYDVLHGARHDPEAQALRDATLLAPSGGAGAYVRDAFLAAGGFDEELFAYLEDVELGIRMREAGMRCVSAPGAFAWHEHSGTLGGGSARKNELLGYGRGYVLWKHGAGLSAVHRLRGMAIDFSVAAGKIAIDRNLGFARGRIRAALELRRRERPPADPRLARVAVIDLGLAAALRVRLSRRRRTPAG